MGWKLLLVAVALFQNASWASEDEAGGPTCGDYFAKVSEEGNQEALEKFSALFDLEADASVVGNYNYSGIYRRYSGWRLIAR